MTKEINLIDILSAIFVIIGGLNWGLVGAIEFNLVEYIFGINSFSRAVYGLVGLSSLYQIYYHYNMIVNK